MGTDVIIFFIRAEIDAYITSVKIIITYKNQRFDNARIPTYYVTLQYTSVGTRYMLVDAYSEGI